MTELNAPTAVDDPTFGTLRVRPDGAVVVEELTNDKRGDYFVWVRGARIYYTDKIKNPEIASWPKLGVQQ